MAFHYEDIFPVIGDLGPFQAVLVLISSLPVIVSAIQTYSPLFTLYTPRHRCRLPESAFSNDTYFPDGERRERDHMRYERLRLFITLGKVVRIGDNLCKF